MDKLAYYIGYMDKEALSMPTTGNLQSMAHRMTPKMMVTQIPALLGFKKSKKVQKRFDNIFKAIERNKRVAAEIAEKKNKAMESADLSEHFIKNIKERVPWIK